MAFHQNEVGYTPIVVGGTYKRKLNSYGTWRLRRYNETHGICVIVSELGTTNYVSESTLKSWHLILT